MRWTTPEALYRLVSAFFYRGEDTADVGCGCGRDTAWLEEQGFPTIGCDPSPAMLREARAAYPHLRLVQAGLPDLGGLREGVFSNGPAPPRRRGPWPSTAYTLTS